MKLRDLPNAAEREYRALTPFEQQTFLEAKRIRSGRWEALAKRHLAKEPWCRGCGGEDALQVHHIVPVHVERERELDPNNLITLCMDRDHLCHFRLGHQGDWRRWNPYVRSIAQAPRPGSAPLAAMAALAPPSILVPRPGGETVTGKMSTFGGPGDHGVTPTEGLALIEPSDLTDPFFAELFLPDSPPNMGLARRLNPAAFYLAMRWDYTRVSRERCRRSLAVLSNPRNKRSCYARLVDWGPNERTMRIADLSIGAANHLGLETNDNVTIALPWS